MIHDADALAEAALHGGHLLLQLLDSSLQLDHFFADPPCGAWWRARSPKQGAKK